MKTISLSRPNPLVLIVAGAMLIGVIGLDRSPATWVDEVFYAEPARMLAMHGHLSAPLYAGLRGLDQQMFLQPPLGFLVQAAVFVVFGFGKWQVRLPGLFEYGLSIALVYWIVESSSATGRRVAWLAALLFACDAGVIEAYRSGRPDLLAISLSLSAALVLIRSSAKPRLESLAAAGLLAASAGMVHAARLVALPGFVIASQLGARNIRERCTRSAACAAGVALPLLAWGAQIVRAPHLWADQFLEHVRGASNNGGRTLLDVLHDTLSHLQYFRSMPLGAALLLVLLIFGASRVTGRGKTALACLASLAPLLLVHEEFVKFIAGLLYVAGALSLDALLSEGRTWLTTRKAKLALAVVVASYLAIPLARLAAILSQWRARDEAPLAEMVRQNVPRNVPVVGSPQGYFAAVDNGDAYYYASPLFGLYLLPRSSDATDFAASMARIKPRYLLLDGAIKPETLKGLPAHSAIERVAAYKPPPLNWWLFKKVGYDMVLWRLRE